MEYIPDLEDEQVGCTDNLVNMCCGQLEADLIKRDDQFQQTAQSANPTSW